MSDEGYFSKRQRSEDVFVDLEVADICSEDGVDPVDPVEVMESLNSCYFDLQLKKEKEWREQHKDEEPIMVRTAFESHFFGENEVSFLILLDSRLTPFEKILYLFYSHLRYSNFTMRKISKSDGCAALGESDPKVIEQAWANLIKLGLVRVKEDDFDENAVWAIDPDIAYAEDGGLLKKEVLDNLIKDGVLDITRELLLCRKRVKEFL